MRDHEHHAHDHGSDHHHAPKDFGRAFAIGIGLNLTYVAVEAGVGLSIGSLALLADAGHNLGDVLGLVLAWAAAIAGKRAPSARYTYGLRGASILAALANAVLLLVACGMIAWEAVGRFETLTPVAGQTVMIVAGIGIIINTATALLFRRGAAGDINIKGAYLHMAADAAVSLGVAVAGALILWTGRSWIDPAVSLGIVAAIVIGTWGLLRQSVAMSLQATPTGIDITEVLATLQDQPGVRAVHDLHIWHVGTTDIALTAHVVMPEALPNDDWHAATAEILGQQFGINHITIQVERGDGPECPQAPDDKL